MSRIGPLEPSPVELRPRLSVDQLLWVANTRHGPGGHWFARPLPGEPDHDHLADAVDAVDYLVRQRLTLPKGRPTPKHLRRLTEIREMTRGLLESEEPGWTPDVRRTLKRTRFRLTAGGEIVSPDKGWDAFLEDLLLPLMQLIPERDRLRICGNPECGLVFMDLSKNGSRRWCDTAGCGNRDRVRRYRGRASAPTAG